MPESLLALLNEPCYACGVRVAQVMDHRHDGPHGERLGPTRGLLCRRCNALAVDPELLRRIVAYVEASPIGDPYPEWLRFLGKVNREIAEDLRA